MKDRKHYLYLLREISDNPFVWMMLAIIALFLMVEISFLFLIPSILILGTIFLVNSLLGRRCPNCGGRLKQMEGRLHPGDQRVVQIIWRCLVDGYEEIETSRCEPDEGGFL
ncbi:MAG: hypothetical protein H6631_13245 [Anaerolineaceae bacterium]|nr:hypothetical protein [Anaerolineaceae bacterium]MCB9098269.1 hypothetical protein [Anaerolineales bacterium]